MGSVTTMDKKELTKDSFSYKIRMLDPFNKGGDIV